jgi:hypothetical protein
MHDRQLFQVQGTHLIGQARPRTAVQFVPELKDMGLAVTRQASQQFLA